MIKEYGRNLGGANVFGKGPLKEIKKSTGENSFGKMKSPNSQDITIDLGEQYYISINPDTLLTPDNYKQEGFFKEFLNADTYFEPGIQHEGTKSSTWFKFAVAHEMTHPFVEGGNYIYEFKEFIHSDYVPNEFSEMITMRNAGRDTRELICDAVAGAMFVPGARTGGYSPWVMDIFPNMVNHDGKYIIE